MTVHDLVASLNLTLVRKPVVGPASVTLTVSNGRAERVFMLPYPLTDKSIETFKNALADWRGAAQP